MAVCTADFEQGTNGSAIQTGDTGSGTAWNTITHTGTSTIVYDTAHVAHGTQSAKFTQDSSGSGPNVLEWIAAIGTPASPSYGRLYFYMTANPASVWELAQVATGGIVSTNMCLYMDITSTGKIRVLGNNVTLQYTFTNSVALNQWVRVEYLVVPSLSVGQLQVKLFNNADSTTPTEDSGLLTGKNTNSAIDRFTYGVVFNGDEPSSTHWYDNLVGNATAFPGPFPVNTTAPGVTGSTPVGSLLTCDGGTWNNGATFTLTYQWTRDGSNIAATSATYTTVTADAGHAVGCTVIATGVQATNESAVQASSGTITVAGSGIIAATNSDILLFHH